MKSLEQRFWEKVDKRSAVECWPWIGGTDKIGRGHLFKYPRMRVAPQISWEIQNGKDFPEGMFACHSCDNPNCVNPSHIWAGSRSENALDALKKGIGFIPQSPNVGKTHCKRGHKFTAENTRVYKNERHCRACKRQRYALKIRATSAALLLSVVLNGCASLPAHSAPALENRTLRISPDLAGFEYQYWICVKRFLGICTRTEMKKETYDLTDVVVRKHLIDMGFVAKVREKP